VRAMVSRFVSSLDTLSRGAPLVACLEILMRKTVSFILVATSITAVACAAQTEGDPTSALAEGIAVRPMTVPGDLITRVDGFHNITTETFD